MAHDTSVPAAFAAWISGASESAKILRFCLIGDVSTLIYAVVALLLSSPAVAGLDATPASVAAYLTGAESS